MQRNYETLVSTHEESRAEHARRKVAFDQVTYAPHGRIYTNLSTLDDVDIRV